MKTLKKPRRRGKILLAILASCLLAFAFLVWRECLPTKMDAAEADKFGAFLQYRLQPEPKGEPTKEVDDMQLLTLDYDVEKFRDGAVIASDTQGLAGLPQVTPGAFQEFFKGQVSAKFPYIWPYVIAGSFTVMGNALGDEPVVAFYNPYFDVAIVTKWKFIADADTEPGFRLMETYPVTGRAFVENRASLATDQPIWVDSKAELLEVRIVNAAQQFIAAFEERYPPFGRGAAVLSAEAGSASVAVPLVEDRVFFLLRWVIDAQNPSAKVNYAAGIRQLHDALSASSPGKLEALLPKGNPQGADLFFNLERGIREGMHPYLVINQNVIFVNTVSLPKAFLSVHFEPTGGGYKPAIVALFNLSASYPSN